MYFYTQAKVSEEKVRGFTLIEILLVIAVFSIIVAVAVPNFTPAFAGIQLKNSTKHLSYLMRYAQSRAVSKNQHVRLVFNSDFSQYWLEEKNNNAESDEYDHVKGRLGRVNHVSGDLDIESSESIIQFYPGGTIDKIRIFVCYEERCNTLSTKEQRGFIHTFEGKIKK